MLDKHTPQSLFAQYLKGGLMDKLILTLFHITLIKAIQSKSIIPNLSQIIPKPLPESSKNLISTYIQTILLSIRERGVTGEKTPTTEGEGESFDGKKSGRGTLSINTTTTVSSGIYTTIVENKECFLIKHNKRRTTMSRLDKNFGNTGFGQGAINNMIDSKINTMTVKEGLKDIPIIMSTVTATVRSILVDLKVEVKDDATLNDIFQMSATNKLVEIALDIVHRKIVTLI